jgi:hypothetical protein
VSSDKREPQRHRDTEKKEADKMKDLLRKPGRQGEKAIDLSSFLVSWVP